MDLETRLDKALDGCAKKKMFGGLVWMLRGNMLAGCRDEELYLRLGEPASKEAIAACEAEPFAMAGRKRISNYVVVPNGSKIPDDQFQVWLAKARRFVESLPPKEK